MSRLGFMAEAERFADVDKAALEKALLGLKVCPHARCRRSLERVALGKDVWGCATCRETWYLPT